MATIRNETDGIKAPRQAAEHFDAFARGTAVLGVLTALLVGIVDSTPGTEGSAVERWITAFFVLMSFLLSALIFHGVAVVLRWMAASYDQATSIGVSSDLQGGAAPAAAAPKREVKIPDHWEKRWE
jgi:hypothetical protein